MKLRPYQQAGLKALHEARKAHVQRPLIAHATGLGKTVLFARFLKDLRRERPGHRALVLAHRDELVRQAIDKLAVVDPKQETGVVKAESDETGAPCVVASVQTLARPERFRRLLEAGPIDTVVVDECHHSAADSYRRLLTDLGSFELGGPFTVGVTATPFRGDKKGLGETWQKIVHHVSILDGIKQGYLCNLRALSVRVQADFQKLRTVAGEIRDDDAGRMLMEAQAPVTIARAIREYAEARPTLVFTPTVAVSQAVAEECRELGLKAEHVDGTTPTEERRDLLRRFHQGTVQVLSNCNVLTEGYDEERIACVVMARPTKSQMWYVQAMGRGTRLHPDKDDCLILDVVGVTHRHDLVTAPQLLKEVFEPEVQHAEQSEFAYREEVEPVTDPTAELYAEPVDLFASHPFAWVRTDFGYVLEVRGRTLALQESDKGWRVAEMFGIANQVLWDGPGLGYAQGIAEDYIRDLGLGVLAKKSADWRHDDMSEGQQRALEKWRIPFNTVWTKGQACDALTRVIAQARFKDSGLGKADLLAGIAKERDKYQW